MKKNHIIPIIFAANNQFVPYTGVAITSLILNSSPDFNYRIYVLHRDISDENVKRLESLGNIYTSVECVNIREQIEGITDFSCDHLRQECVYRLLIPELFPQYEKIIYLDSDLIVAGNIVEFYDNDIDGYLLGAVHDVCTPWIEAHYRADLGLSSLNGFNSGVLLMNIPLLRQKNIKSQCLRLLEEDAKWDEPKLSFLDQDALNITCEGNVLFLSIEWNFQAIYLCFEENRDTFAEHILFPKYRNLYLEAEENCKIIHYAGGNKPWKCSNFWIPKAEEFWRVAEQTIFYEELRHQYETSEKQSAVSRVPLCNIRKDSRIILYGAGKLGNWLWTELRRRHYCQIVLWVDRNAAQLSETNKNVRDISEISKVEYDQIVITVVDKDVRDSIVSYLTDQGIPREKIVWAHQPKEKGA